MSYRNPLFHDGPEPYRIVVTLCPGVRSFRNPQLTPQPFWHLRHSCEVRVFPQEKKRITCINIMTDPTANDHLPEILLPHPNTYHVPGTRIIAGEYPFHIREDAGVDKLRRYVLAGITNFVDLTEEGELRPYEAALTRLAEEHGRKVEHRRLGICDVSVPTVERMTEILDTLDSVEAAGGLAYVHCWGGVGRTGTVVGCSLVRRGWDPEKALSEVTRLHGSTRNVRTGLRVPTSPETEEQRQFVRHWTEVETSQRPVFPPLG